LPGKGGDQRRNGEAKHFVADEADNGVINGGSQEISRDDLDDGTASARVRFEIDEAKSKRNGVRCENDGQSVDGASQVLTKNPKTNDNPRYEGDISPVIVVQRDRANGAKSAGKRKNSRGTNDAEVVGDENADASRVAEEKPAVVDIVKCLVESR